MFAGLFMAVNIVAACYVVIRMGYGPPNWQSALNLVVRLTTLQDCLNEARDWLEEKYPRSKQLFDRLKIPKPIIIVDTTPLDDEPPNDEPIDDEPIEEEDKEPQTESGVSTEESALSAVAPSIP